MADTFNDWLSEMTATKPTAADETGDVDVLELPAPEPTNVDLGESKPQGLREVRYNKPGTPQSLFNPANKPEQSEAAAAAPAPAPAPAPAKKSYLEQRLEEIRKRVSTNPVTEPEPDTTLQAMQENLAQAMKLSQEQAEQRRQQQQNQQQEQAVSSAVLDELVERVDKLETDTGKLFDDLGTLEGRVTDIEGNYVGQQTFQDSIDAFEEKLAQVLTPTIINIPERPQITFSKRTHVAFNEVLFLAEQFQQVYIVGPAGTGKTTLADDVAKALGLKFGFISCTAGMAEAHLLGRMLADGTYLGTSFVNCYENGGVFLFDEVDAADANTMLVINSALANGILSVPNRAAQPVARRHADFVCIVAANTLGTGSFEYHGRNYLDAAFLDRFALSKERVDYDVEMEREMIAGDAEMGRVLHKIRFNLEATKTRRILSTRAFQGTTKLLLAGKPPQYVIDKLMLGWTSEEVARAMKDVVVPKRSPLFDVGLKQREAAKTRREQAAAEAKKAKQPDPMTEPVLA
ncbi:AAA family ATPase [Hymenobacter siberiensis]|uniref:AAA family ATPase n=1 Tax=Hymenobacter siberiensis TaxID=2848396 RepID=UPI001C1E3F5F|nr:AAA family ATPase [Hymenobacter siberiensis]